MKTKKNKLPEFSKMTYEEKAKFWDKHSFAEYWDEMKDVEIEVKLEHGKPIEETRVLQVNKDVKRKLDQVAKERGITISALARDLLIEKLRTVENCGYTVMIE